MKKNSIRKFVVSSSIILGVGLAFIVFYSSLFVYAKCEDCVTKEQATPYYNTYIKFLKDNKIKSDTRLNEDTSDTVSGKPYKKSYYSISSYPDDTSKENCKLIKKHLRSSEYKGMYLKNIYVDGCEEVINSEHNSGYYE